MSRLSRWSSSKALRTDTDVFWSSNVGREFSDVSIGGIVERDVVWKRL